MATSFLYFDVGNVLLKFSHERQCAQMAAVANVDVVTMQRAIFDAGLFGRCERGELSEQEIYEELCAALDVRPDFEALKRAGSDIFWCHTPMVPVIGHLMAAGHRLGILSNTSESHWSWIADGRYAILPNSFEQLVLSHEVGAMKPDEKIYRVAIERAGVPPGEIFFTDDKPENVEAARQLGIDAEPFTSVEALVRQLRARGIRFNL